MAGRRLRVVARYTLLTALAAIVLFPLYITVVNSLLPSQQLLARPPRLFPSSPEWDTYRRAWNAGHLGRYLKNSFIVTALIVNPNHRPRRNILSAGSINVRAIDPGMPRLQARNSTSRNFDRRLPRPSGSARFFRHA